MLHDELGISIADVQCDFKWRRPESLHFCLPTIFDVFDLIRDKREAEFDQLFRDDLLGSDLQFFFVGDEFLHCDCEWIMINL